MPVADSSSIIRQWRSRLGRSCFRWGQANPTAIRNAPVQRQYANVIGGTTPATPRPSTMLPDQNRLLSTSSGQADFHRFITTRLPPPHSGGGWGGGTSQLATPPPQPS